MKINTTRLVTTAESEHSVWELDIVRQVIDGVYSNVYVRQTALFSHHLTEGLKPAHGDYPQAQLKPELHQENKKIDETVRGFIEGEDDPVTFDTGLGRALNSVYLIVMGKWMRMKGRTRTCTTQSPGPSVTGWQCFMLPRDDARNSLKVS